MDRELDLNNDNEEVIEVSLKEYNSIQIYHIKKHKWFLSERVGADVGFNEAAKNWITTGLAQKFRNKFRLIK